VKGMRGQQEDHAQRDAIKGQPAEHVVLGTIGSVVGPGVKELFLEALHSSKCSTPGTL